MTNEQEAVKYWRSNGYVELRDGNTVWLYQHNEQGVAYKREANGWDASRNIDEWDRVVNSPVLSRLRKIYRFLFGTK